MPPEIILFIDSWCKWNGIESCAPLLKVLISVIFKLFLEILKNSVPIYHIQFSNSLTVPGQKIKFILPRSGINFLYFKHVAFCSAHVYWWPALGQLHCWTLVDKSRPALALLALPVEGSRGYLHPLEQSKWFSFYVKMNLPRSFFVCLAWCQ